MLLDQKKTKRMVKIVSIICAVGFVGVLPVVLGLVVFGGGPSTAQDAAKQAIKDAEAKVSAAPGDVTALVDLATQYRAANRTQDAAVTLQRAVTAGAKNSAELTTLVTGLSDSPALQLQVLQTYTKSHPKDGEAFFTYGSTAERAGQILAARLAFQRAVQVAPKGSALAQSAQQALNRVKRTPIPVTPSATVTSTAPATPATP